MRTRTTGALAVVLVLTAAGCTTPAAQAPGPSASASPAPPTPAFAAQLRPKLTEAMARLKLPGAIVEVDVPGKGTWLEALGSGTADGATPITIDDHLKIGSVSKTITAEVILQLADEGKLGLDDPVAKYLPQIPGGDRITLRQLLDMTAGLFNFTEDDYLNRTLDQRPPQVWTVDAVLATALAHPPYFAPGTGFHYSNTNYEVLGLVAQKVGNAPLGTLMHDLVFTKLGMTSTTLPAVDDGTIPQPHPHGYMYGTNIQGTDAYNALVAGNLAEAQIKAADGTKPNDVTDDPVTGPASGAVISTARDMTIWAKALGTGQLLKPATRTARANFGTTHYGLGLQQQAGGLIGHNGAVPGFQTFVGYQPSTGATVVVLTNLLLTPNIFFPDALPADTLAGIIQQNLLPAA
ncbi:beta-lactamase family protein [Amycolatopsis sp. NBC_01307]|uniref:serine hydrolase domain-containing protein n=1 Tax=Amycolatopsis sp. NBC_01307 TaxID=2903561 RepID=UPI002E15B343|nr:beta-lactamase family protein [Amycolatopsis sp. NBC_01307]